MIDFDLASLVESDMQLRTSSGVTPRRFGPLSLLAALPSGGLVTFLESPRFAGVLRDATGHVVVTRPELAEAIPEGNDCIVTTGSPKEAFCRLAERAIDQGRYETLASYRSPTARVHPTATVGEHVYVDDDADVGPGVVVYPNTYVGVGARLQANSVVGDDGFETTSPTGPRRVLRHAGGVWFDRDTRLGSTSCVDKGLYGDFTYLGVQTLTDHHVYVAHAVACGPRCTIGAGVILLGWVQLGSDVWIGPASSVNQLLRIGAGAFLGTGSVVRHDVLPYALVYGDTARQKGWSCVCHSRLDAQPDEGVECATCGRSYRLERGEVDGAPARLHLLAPPSG